MRTCTSSIHVGERTLVSDVYFYPAMTRTCKKCARVRAAESRIRRAGYNAQKTKDWTEANPKRAKQAYQQWYKANKETILTKGALERANKDEYRLKRKQQYHNNKEHYRCVARKFLVEHPDVARVNNARRRAAKQQAVASWYKFEVRGIKALYKKAKELTLQTGILYHVDHIVPLINESVCGLHCLNNLQILTAEQNISKSNKF